MLLNYAYGQRIRLDVFAEYGKGGKPILWTDSLRVDFEYNSTGEYERASVEVYNLSEEGQERIGRIGNYVTLTVIHHGVPNRVFSNFIVNNAHTETKVPENVTTLYCAGASTAAFASNVSNLHKNEFKITDIFNHILSGRAKQDGTGTDVTINVEPIRGTPIRVRLEGFTDKIKNKVWRTNKGLTFGCNVYAAFKRYSTQFNYDVRYGEEIVITYRGTGANGKATYDRIIKDPGKHLVLKVEDMKANPRMSSATMEIHSILNPEIRYGQVIDTSKLFSASIKENTEVLQVSPKFLLSAVKVREKYFVVSVEHKGSNFTGKWDTFVTAYPPARNNKDAKEKT